MTRTVLIHTRMPSSDSVRKVNAPLLAGTTKPVQRTEKPSAGSAALGASVPQLKSMASVRVSATEPVRLVLRKYSPFSPLPRPAAAFVLGPTASKLPLNALGPVSRKFRAPNGSPSASVAPASNCACVMVKGVVASSSTEPKNTDNGPCTGARLAGVKYTVLGEATPAFKASLARRLKVGAALPVCTKRMRPNAGSDPAKLWTGAPRLFALAK